LIPAGSTALPWLCFVRRQEFRPDKRLLPSYFPDLSVFKELFQPSLFTPRPDAGAGKLLILKLKPHKEGTLLTLGSASFNKG
jgi:hypothetical protein